MIVRCSIAFGFRVENLNNCTSGIPVIIANNPLAVEKCGVKQRSKKIPFSAIELKYGVVLSGLPLMLLLYMLNDSHNTSTTFGLLSSASVPGITCLLKSNSFCGGNCNTSFINGNTSFAFCSLYSGLRKRKDRKSVV